MLHCLMLAVPLAVALTITLMIVLTPLKRHLHRLRRERRSARLEEAGLAYLGA